MEHLLNAYKMQNQGLSIRKNSVRIKLSQRQFGIEVRKYEMLSGIYYKMVLLKVRRIASEEIGFSEASVAP